MFVQHVHEVAIPSVVDLDWAAVSYTERQAKLTRILRREDLRPFSDADSCRLRALFIKTGPQEALLVVIVDHVTFDGFSASLVLQGLKEALTAQSASDRRAPRAGIGMPAFAMWQKWALQTSYFRGSVAFWRDQWARFARYRIAHEDLPFGLMASPEPDRTFASEDALLGATEAAALRALAQQSRTTIFVICLAALARVLSAYTDRSVVAIWSHFLNRVQPGTMCAVGWFNNTHLLGFELPRNVTGRKLIEHVNRVVSNAQVHQEMPLQHLWNTLKCIPRFPEPRVLMDFRSRPARLTGDGSSRLSVENATLPTPTTPRFSDLGFYITDNFDSIQIEATFWRARFSRSGVIEILTELKNAILGLVEDPDAVLINHSTPEREAYAKMSEFLLFDGACIPRVE